VASYFRFLLVDDVAENRLLITKTILKRFPNAVVHECQDAATAVAVAAHEHPSAVVAHRTAEVDGATLAAMIHRGNAAIPIVVMSGRPTQKTTLLGVMAVIGWDEWQTTADILAEIVGARPGNRPSE
jgi:CheY-like chemotaxis protein